MRVTGENVSSMTNFLNCCYAHLHLSLPCWCHKSMPLLYMLPHCTPNVLTHIPHTHIHWTNNCNVAHAPTMPTLQILHRTCVPPHIIPQFYPHRLCHFHNHHQKLH